MVKENHKLKKNNTAVRALYTWIKIKLHESKQQNNSKKNYNKSKEYKHDLFVEIKKNIDPLLSKSNEPLILGDDLKLNWYGSIQKRDLELTYKSLNKFDGIIEFKNVNKLEPEDILLMSRYVKYKYYPKNSFIFKEGDNPKYLYIIIKGCVQIIERRFLDRTQEIKEILVKEENIHNNQKMKKNEKDDDSEAEKDYFNVDENDENLSLEAYWRRKENIFLKKERLKREKIKYFLERYDPEKNMFQLSQSSIEKDKDYINRKNKEIENYILDINESSENDNITIKNKNEGFTQTYNTKNIGKKKVLKMKLKNIDLHKKCIGNKIHRSNSFSFKQKNSNFENSENNMINSDRLYNKKKRRSIAKNKEKEIDFDINNINRKVSQKIDKKIFKNIKNNFYIKFKNKTKKDKNERAITPEVKPSKAIKLKSSLIIFNIMNTLYYSFPKLKKCKSFEKLFSNDDMYNNSKKIYMDEHVFNLIRQLQNFKTELNDEDFFGDEALRYNTLEEYSVYCLKDTHLITLHRDYYNKFLFDKINKNEKKMKNFVLNKFPLLKDDKRYNLLINKLRPHYLTKNQYIYTHFDYATDLFLVYSGECSIVKPIQSFEDKDELLLEKPKFKIISTINPGGFAGYESCVREKNLIGQNKYDNCLIVTGLDAIIFKIPIKDFMDKKGLFYKCIHSMKKQRKTITESSTNHFNILLELKKKIKKKEEDLKYNSNENNDSENILKRYNSNENESNDKSFEESNNNLNSNFKRTLVKRHSVVIQAKININNIVNENTETKSIKNNNETNKINISKDFILTRKTFKHETNPLPQIKSNSFYGKVKSHNISKDKSKFKNSQISLELTNNLRKSEENKKSNLFKTKFILKMNKMDEYLNFDFFAQKKNSQDNYTNNKILKENNNKIFINQCSDKYLKNEKINKSLSPKKKHINYFNQKTEKLNTINKNKKEFKNKDYLKWNKNIKSNKKKNENNIKKYCKALKINICSSILKQSKQGYNSGDFTLPLVSQLKTNKK